MMTNLQHLVYMVCHQPHSRMSVVAYTQTPVFMSPRILGFVSDLQDLRTFELDCYTRRLPKACFLGSWSRLESLRFHDLHQDSYKHFIPLLERLKQRPQGGLARLGLMGGFRDFGSYGRSPPPVDLPSSDEFVNQTARCLSHLRALALWGVVTTRERLRRLLSETNNLVELTITLKAHVSPDPTYE